MRRPLELAPRRALAVLCLAALAAVLVACGADSASFPAGDPPGDPPGRDGGGTTPSTDAGVPDDGGGTDLDAGPRPITARLCVINDLELPAQCSAVARAGLVIKRLGTTDEATTAENGTFSFVIEPGVTRVLLTVDDPELDLAPAAVVLNPDDAAAPLPVLSRFTLEDVVAASSVPVLNGPGHVVVVLRQGAAPPAPLTLGALAGVLAAYDQGNGLVFQTFGDTGETGTAIYFNAAADTTAPFPEITADLPGTTMDPKLAVPVVGDRTLVVRWTLPPPPP